MAAGWQARGSRFALATLGGYLLSVWIGLFGFNEVRTTAGIVAGVIEVAAFAVLAALALPRPGGRPGAAAGGARRRPGYPARIPAIARAAATTAAALAVAALVLLGIAEAGAGLPRQRPRAGGRPEDRQDRRRRRC